MSGRSGLQKLIQMRQSPAFCPIMVTPSGSFPRIGKSEKRAAFCPDKSAAEMALAFARSVSTSSFFCAKTSTANSPFKSVAVVMIGSAPSILAKYPASSFARPTWPESSGIQNRPFSSITTTAGSCSLSATKGAIARTAMPHAPTKTRQSDFGNCCAVQSCSEPCQTLRPLVSQPPAKRERTKPAAAKSSPKASSSRAAAAAPFWVKQISESVVFILSPTALPGGTRW